MTLKLLHPLILIASIERQINQSEVVFHLEETLQCLLIYKLTEIRGAIRTIAEILARESLTIVINYKIIGYLWQVPRLQVRIIFYIYSPMLHVLF